MSKRESLIRYSLIIRRVRKSTCTYNEIDAFLQQESLLQGYNLNISKRTFNRNLDDIRSIYNIDIQYSFTQQCYYINAAEGGQMSNRLIEAFDTFNAFQLTNQLAEFVYFEKRKPIGTEYLHQLIDAIKNQLMVNFTYFKYREDTSTQRIAKPLALKEYKDRWYLIAEDTKDDTLKSFAFDRIQTLTTKTEKYALQKSYNIEAFYQSAFGIIVPERAAPQEVLLTFTRFQGEYIKSMPLHQSQQIISDTKHQLQVKLHVYITYDLIMEIISMGANVKVLAPQILKNEVINAHRKALEQYNT